MASISSSLTKSITQSKSNPCGTKTCHYEELIVHQVKIIRKIKMKQIGDIRGLRTI